MTVRTDIEAEQTRAALRTLRDAVSTLAREVAPVNPSNFALLSEGYSDDIDRLEKELDEYFAYRTRVEKARRRRTIAASALVGLMVGGGVAAALVAAIVRPDPPPEPAVRAEDLRFPAVPPERGFTLAATLGEDDAGTADSVLDAGTATMTADQLELRCRRGNHGVCFTLASRAEAARDFEAARTFYALGCEAGHDRSCYHAGRLALRASDASAREFLSQACAAGHSRACWDLARLETREDTSVAAIAGYLRRACDGDIADACDRLGVLRADEGNMAGAAQLFREACELGAPGGCANLAFSLFNGRGVAADPEEAVRLYERACDAGVPSACAAEVFIRRSRSQFRDPERVVEARRRGCELGELALCEQ